MAISISGLEYGLMHVVKCMARIVNAYMNMTNPKITLERHCTIRVESRL